MRTVVALLLSLGLAGCASHTLYGNFVDTPAGLDQRKIAGDTVDQLETLYPPAKTRFELKHPTPDAFGIAFVQKLRSRGYALLEFDPEAGKAQPPSTRPDAAAPNTTASSSPAFPSTGAVLPLRYVFDQFTGTDLYRVTVLIGNKSITRAYSKESGTVVPAAYWVRKE